MTVKRSWFGHPPGLTILFLTETWEVFSFYGLRTILIYYMISGLHFSQAQASLVYGIYVAGASLSNVFGGIVCDVYLGPRRAIIIGAGLMVIGHLTLVFPSLIYVGLAVIALGSGLYSPSLPSQVDRLYDSQDPRRARAFNIYYLGINLGAFLAPLAIGTLAERIGWHYGFALAGFGMFVGLSTYLAGRRLLTSHAGWKPRSVETAAARSTKSFLPSNFVFLVSVWLAVLTLRVAYEQTGNTVPLWIAKADRTIGAFTIPMTWFQSFNPLFIFAGTPILLAVWSVAERRGFSISPVTRLMLGCGLIAAAFACAAAVSGEAAFAGRKISAAWIVWFFLLSTLGELCVFPTGLALFSAAAPRRFEAITMSAWYLCGMPAGLISGIVGRWWSGLGPITFFSLLTAIALAALAQLFVLRLAIGSEPPEDARARLRPT